jgi:hypothetical protein
MLAAHQPRCVGLTDDRLEEEARDIVLEETLPVRIRSASRVADGGGLGGVVVGA